MNVHRQAASALVRAPAKLNLFFEVLGKRSDGFHEIESLMVPIGIYDQLIATSTSDGLIQLSCRWAAPHGDAARELGELPPAAANLATRAVELLRTRAGVELGLRMELVKRIPSAAGLGGGSSDAAAALLAANAVWNLNWSRDALATVAAELGSDVPFFLGHGAAICRGRGEQIEPVEQTGNLHFVVVRPPEGLATASVYAGCQVAMTPRQVTPLVEALKRGDTRSMSRLVHNRLEAAAASLSPWIGRLRGEFAKQDCVATQMSGSGSSYFGICRHARHASRVARRLQARGVGHVFAVSTSG